MLQSAAYFVVIPARAPSSLKMTALVGTVLSNKVLVEEVLSIKLTSVLTMSFV